MNIVYRHSNFILKKDFYFGQKSNYTFAIKVCATPTPRRILRSCLQDDDDS
jgi:hypothetical protein